MRSSNLATALAVAAVAATFALPASAPAAPLGLDYTATTTNWTEFPGRAEQETYQPCAAPLRLVGIGAWVGESIPPQPFRSAFPIGRMYNVSIRPYDQFEGPEPDSTQQVADNLFGEDASWTLGESTACADSADGLAYPSRAKRNPKRSRSAVSVRCTGGRSVLSGGGWAGGPFRSQRLVSSAPYDGPDKDTRPDDGWRVAIDNLSSRARRIEAFAICARPDAVSYRSKKFRSKKRSRRHVAVACP
ncbi:MAG TPA: hypothetical protein VK919_00455, partial [Solirubrobacterales bacterium]|nr:hypothetical protein [Solirubrobacterales bacterium]